MRFEDWFYKYDTIIIITVMILIVGGIMGAAIRADMADAAKRAALLGQCREDGQRPYICEALFERGSSNGAVIIVQPVVRQPR